MSASYSNNKLLQLILLLCSAGALAYACYNTSLLAFKQSTSAANNLPADAKQSTIKSGGEQKIQYSEIAQWHLFGAVLGKTSPAPKKKVVIAPKTRLKLELLGVFSDKKTGDGWAIISEKGGSHKIYRIGGELPGNAVLYAVEANRVTLERNGQYESLPLKKPGSLNNTRSNPNIAFPATAIPSHPSRKTNKPKRI